MITTKKKSKYIEFKPHSIQTMPDCFHEELWWVTSDEVFGYRLMMVTLPPIKGACSDHEITFRNLEWLGDDYPPHTEFKSNKLKDWSWIQYIPSPNINYRNLKYDIKKKKYVFNNK